MSRIILQIVSYVAVLATVSLWPGTEASSQRPRLTTPTPTAGGAFNQRPLMSTKTPSPTSNPQDVGTPCEGITCPTGRRCAVDENKQASCVCGGYCYGYYYSPVCGSDNRTYPSECALTEEACKTNSHLAVIYYDQCRTEGSLCFGTTCPSNRECAVAENHATCVCIQTCPTYSYPVCGSDNQTYVNDCYLRRHSCMTSDDITLAYTGVCKQVTVCDGHSCPTGMKCAIDQRHQPVCVCNDTSCPYTSDTVCGSDGRTYPNECELQKEACTSATHTRVAYKGFCLEGSVCDGYRCPSDKECSVNQNNQAVCACNQTCPYDYNPVCGSDGNTYQNLCDLKRVACTRGNNLTLARNGPCIYYEYCYGVVCPSPKSCVVDAENQTSCVFYSNCGDYYYPVCGSDNTTYDSYCQLYAKTYETNSNLTINYYGVCSEGSNCQGIYCPYGKHCDSQHQPEPKCVCDTYCPKTYSPVCGSNNKTYNNSCELQREACLTNTSIAAQFNKRCDEGPGCDYTYCPYGRTCVLDERKRPVCVCSMSCYGFYEVCGSDDKTYSNECFLNAAACLTNKTISVQRYGQCQEANPCKGVACSWDSNCKVRPNGEPTCVCNEDCSSYGGSPVCGSDNKTYANYCELRRQSCLSSSSILWLYYGSCVEASACDRMSCSPDKRCAIDEQHQPTCVCIEQCVKVQYPVCGSDGRTYSNECELQKEACMSHRNVTLAYRGQCNQGLTCNEVSCTNGRKCALNEKNQPTCVCNKYADCSYYSYPVCGTNGKTYFNDCYLQVEACTTDTNTKVDYYGSCRNDASSSSTTTNKPCIGSLCTSTSPVTANRTTPKPRPF